MKQVSTLYVDFEIADDSFDLCLLGMSASEEVVDRSFIGVNILKEVFPQMMMVLTEVVLENVRKNISVTFYSRAKIAEFISIVFSENVFPFLDTSVRKDLFFLKEKLFDIISTTQEKYLGGEEPEMAFMKRVKLFALLHTEKESVLRDIERIASRKRKVDASSVYKE